MLGLLEQLTSFVGLDGEYETRFRLVASGKGEEGVVLCLKTRVGAGMHIRDIYSHKRVSRNCTQIWPREGDIYCVAQT